VSAPSRHVVVMITTSYPRFPGDGIGSFIAPIAKGVAARGHEVHLVAPAHPEIRLPAQEDGVRFHFYKYAPGAATSWGYATGLRADTALRGSAWAAAPLGMAAGVLMARRVASRHRATMLHAHWVIPNGVIAAVATRSLPIVTSLHGSDVFVAERNGLARRAARYAFTRADWVTACSDDLRDRAVRLGADATRIATVPYGVDTVRFAPDAEVRHAVRRELGIGDAPFVFTAGRLVSKKGFEYLIDAAALLGDLPTLHVGIAGAGDLHGALTARAAPLGGRVRLLGNQSQDDIARFSAAADVVVVPSIRDDAGNVDGLPNFALEALASATPVIASRAGGLPDVIEDGVHGLLVPERDAAAIAEAIRHLMAHGETGRRIGRTARIHVSEHFGWARTAAMVEQAYDRALSGSVGRSM
jgi:glycosyltransferase involved in cell wall biosynthesis